jgi:hypothetical protein
MVLSVLRYHNYIPPLHLKPSRCRLTSCQLYCFPLSLRCFHIARIRMISSPKWRKAMLLQILCEHPLARLPWYAMMYWIGDVMVCYGNKSWPSDTSKSRAVADTAAVMVSDYRLFNNLFIHNEFTRLFIVYLTMLSVAQAITSNGRLMSA